MPYQTVGSNHRCASYFARPCHATRRHGTMYVEKVSKSQPFARAYPRLRPVHVQPDTMYCQSFGRFSACRTLMHLQAPQVILALCNYSMLGRSSHFLQNCRMRALMILLSLALRGSQSSPQTGSLRLQPSRANLGFITWHFLAGG